MKKLHCWILAVVATGLVSCQKENITVGPSDPFGSSLANTVWQYEEYGVITDRSDIYPGCGNPGDTICFGITRFFFRPDGICLDMGRYMPNASSGVITCRTEWAMYNNYAYRNGTTVYTDEESVRYNDSWLVRKPMSDTFMFANNSYYVLSSENRAMYNYRLEPSKRDSIIIRYIGTFEDVGCAPYLAYEDSPDFYSHYWSTFPDFPGIPKKIRVSTCRIS